MTRHIFSVGFALISFSALAACQSWPWAQTVAPEAPEGDAATPCTVSVNGIDAWINQQPRVDEAPSKDLHVLVNGDASLNSWTLHSNGVSDDTLQLELRPVEPADKDREQLALRLAPPKPQPSRITLSCNGEIVARTDEILIVY